MVSLRVLVFVLVLTLLGVIVESENSKGSKLAALYNSKVVKAEVMVQPLGNGTRTFGPISHTGVRVTLENGDQWLIHKGLNFGRFSDPPVDSDPQVDSDTVVVDAKYMSNRWKNKRTKNFYRHKTVGDFVRAAGKRYNLLTANCHHATRDMMNQ